MRVVVTGGAGQLGSRLLRRLAHDRKVKAITCIDLRPHAIASPKITAVKCDVRDPDIARHIEGHDALVHLAFVVTEARPRPEVEAINVGGSANVFAAAARCGVSRIVYSSSIAAYGVVPGHPQPITEEISPPTRLFRRATLPPAGVCGRCARPVRLPARPPPLRRGCRSSESVEPSIQLGSTPAA